MDVAVSETRQSPMQVVNDKASERPGVKFSSLITHHSSLMLRLVLDTNVWLDWLVFDDPVVAPIRTAVAEGKAAVFIDEAVEAELVRVLGYSFGARTLDAQQQAKAIADCLQVARKDER